MRVIVLATLVSLALAATTKEALHRGLMNMGNFARSLQGRDLMNVDVENCANPRQME